MDRKLTTDELKRSMADITSDPAAEIMEEMKNRRDSTKYQEMEAFLENPKFVLSRGDPKTMVFTTKGGWYTFATPDEQAVFFSYYEACRRDCCMLDFAERQNKDRSGIFIDFDLLQDSQTRKFDDELLNRLMTQIGKTLAEVYDLSMIGGVPVVFVSVEVKPEILPKPEEDKKFSRVVYKDGIHLRILTTLVSQASKRYFVKCLQTSARRIMVNYLNSGDALDEGAVNNPVFLYGANRKRKPAYKFHSMWKLIINGRTDVVAMKQDKFFEKRAKRIEVDGDESEEEERKSKHEKSRRERQMDEIIISHELSMNFERSDMHNGQIKKYPVDVLDSCAAQVAKFDKIADVPETTTSQLDSLLSQDPQADFLRKIIDILNPVRAEKYPLWIRVIWALANTSDKYRSLAEYFSRKCPDKFVQSEFDKTWKEALKSAKDDTHFKYNKSSLCGWAKTDNPEKFAVVSTKDVEFMITKMVYDKVCSGDLEQYQIAQIINSLIGDRYAVDSEDGSKRMTFYEFVLPEDGMMCKPGEAYKYRVTNEASFLHVYISEQVTRYMRSVFNKMSKVNKQEDDEDEKPKKVKGKAKWHVKVQKNFEVTMRKLYRDVFKNGVITQFRHIRHKHTAGFSATLNKDPLVLGVHNGIVELHNDGGHTFVRGYHPHKISHSTNCNYVEFDPTDPTTAKLLRVTRQIMPDHEPDTHNWLMHFFASSIDGCVKDQYFVTGFGDGANAKSFIVELHRNTMGDTYAVSLPVGSITAKNLSGGQATPDLWMLLWARAAFISESGLMQKINSAMIKLLTGQEHVPMRGLFRDMISAKPKCIFFMITNFLLELSDTTYGCFRRMKIIHFPMQFCVDPEDFDPKNPFHRIADVNLSKEFNSDPDVCSRWLSIMLWYRMSLYRKYKGSLANIPHPHIINMTNEYRSTQDKVNVFINSRCILGPKLSKQQLSEAMELYINWYISNVDASAESPKLKHGLQSKFLSSAIAKYIKKDGSGVYYLEKCRIMKPDEHPSKGEILFSSKHTVSVSDDLPAEMAKPVEANDESDESDEKSDSDDSDDDKKKKKKKSKKDDKKEKQKNTSAKEKEDDFEVVEKPISTEGFDPKTEGQKFKQEVSKAKEDASKIEPETAEQFYERIVREWKEWKTSVTDERVVHDSEKNEMIETERMMSAAQTREEYEKHARQLQERMHSTHSWSISPDDYQYQSNQGPSLSEDDVQYILSNMT